MRPTRTAAWPGRAPEAYRHRAMLDEVGHLVDRGIKWRAVPAGFPPWDRVYAFFRRRRDHALVKSIRDQNLTHRHGNLRSLLTGDCAGEGGASNQYCDRPRVLCRHGRHGRHGRRPRRPACPVCLRLKEPSNGTVAEALPALAPGTLLAAVGPAPQAGPRQPASPLRTRRSASIPCGAKSASTRATSQSMTPQGRGPAEPAAGLAPRGRGKRLRRLDRCGGAGRLDLVARTRRHGRPAVALRFTTSLDVRRERDWLRPSDLREPDRVLD
ncbi:transposase [Streptomyces europaeiscabiei]